MKTVLIVTIVSAVAVGLTLLAFVKSPVLGVIAAAIFATWWVFEMYQLYRQRKGGRK